MVWYWGERTAAGVNFILSVWWEYLLFFMGAICTRLSLQALCSVQSVQELAELFTLAALGEGKENILFCATFWSVLFCVKAFLLPEENTLKGLQCNWLLKAGVIKLWIHHSGIFTNIFPVLCLLLLLFWCWMSSVYSSWPSSNYENNHYFHALALRMSMSWTLWGLWDRAAPGCFESFSIALFNFFKFVQLCISEYTTSTTVERSLASAVNEDILFSAYT